MGIRHGAAVLIQPPDGELYLVSFIKDATAAGRAQAEIVRLEHEVLSRATLLAKVSQLLIADPGDGPG
jgi:hypothetical protein